MLFDALVLFPRGERLVGGSRFIACEYPRVTAYEFFAQLVANVVEIELARAPRYIRLQQRLQSLLQRLQRLQQRLQNLLQLQILQQALLWQHLQLM